MKRMASPVLFLPKIILKIKILRAVKIPRVAMTEDGLYIDDALYGMESKKASVATSPRSEELTKHGLAFDKAYNGRFNNLSAKSGSILTN